MHLQKRLCFCTKHSGWLTLLDLAKPNVEQVGRHAANIIPVCMHSYKVLHIKQLVQDDHNQCSPWVNMMPYMVACALQQIHLWVGSYLGPSKAPAGSGQYSFAC